MHGFEAEEELLRSDKVRELISDLHASFIVGAQCLARKCIKGYACSFNLTETDSGTVRLRGILVGTGISGTSQRVPIFPFATHGGKQASSYFQQRNWVQACEAQIWFPAG